MKDSLEEEHSHLERLRRLEMEKLHLSRERLGLALQEIGSMGTSPTKNMYGLMA